MNLSDVFSIYEKEKKNPNKLEKLPDQFYKRLSEMVKRYKRLLELGEQDSEEHKKLLIELDNLKELIKQIINIRIEKLLKLALFEVKENIRVAERSDMTKEEQILFDILINILKSYYKNVLNVVLLGEHPNVQNIFEELKPLVAKKIKTSNKVIVIFNKDFSQIVAPDGKIYGPFKQQEIYLLPKELANRLCSIGICEKVKIRKD